MQKLLEIISTKQFRNVFFFILFTVLLTGTISSQNYFFQKVIENGISKRDIVAQRDIKVIDTKKTELHKKEVAASVEPILTKAEDDFMTSSLITLHKSVIKIREKEVSEKVKYDELSVLFEESQSKGVIEYLLKAGDTELNTLFDKSKVVLASVLNSGISSRDFDNNNVVNVIRKNIPNSTQRSQANMITNILNQVIVPNLVVDEFATEIAKKNAQDTVKPYEVVFKKGQKILFEGEPVTKLKSDALRAAGYNVLEVNFVGILGIFILVSFFTFIFLQYVKNFEKEHYNSKSMTIMASFTFLTSFFATLLPTGFSPYILPIPSYTIILSIFTTPRNAFFASTILVAMLSMGMHYSVEVVVTFLLLNAVVMVAMSNLKFSKRSDLLLISLKISVAGILVVGGIYILEKFMMDINNLLILRDIGYIVLNCFVISGVFLLGLLPIIENIFRVLTPYGLAELADYNQPLLKELMEKASGTYSHSLLVSQLCEAAAEAIGANSILARVGAMYHDIGKLERPLFFVENQSFLGIENPHKNCTPKFSKMIITAHPKDGMEKAKIAKLPKTIIDFIIQHHGTTLVTYFYNEALKSEGNESVDEEQFRYPGPKPNSKETAILMIADAVESAVRAAKDPSSDEIDTIIKKIIRERLNDGQFSEAPLTLKELSTIGEALAKMLKGMHHERIKYHNDLVNELETINHTNSKEDAIYIPQTLDADLENKIKELEDKKNEQNENN